MVKVRKWLLGDVVGDVVVGCHWISWVVRYAWNEQNPRWCK